MSAPTQPFEFEKYVLRAATAEDLEIAEEWTDQDPDHHDRVHGTFWTEQGPGIDSYVLCDRETMQPVFFFRMEQVVRIHIQFPPTPTKREGMRVATALQAGMNWLKMALGCGKTREIVFDSTTKLLRLFCTGKLGFEARPNTLSAGVLRLPPRPSGPSSNPQG